MVAGEKQNGKWVGVCTKNQGRERHQSGVVGICRKEGVYGGQDFQNRGNVKKKKNETYLGGRKQGPKMGKGTVAIS